MAALSSTQSGNWSSASTWGGTTPSDGDTFTINRGHKVTVNSDQRPTNGWGDVALYGKLEIVSGGQFRLNGRITLYGNGAGGYFAEGNSTSNSFLHMTAGSSMEIRGSNSDQHGIWMETQQHCQMIMEGTAKNLNTNLSAATDYGAAYLPVDNASNFAAGDWVTVFNREEDYRVCSDEGFWVHDIDETNNVIYIRQFVAPTAVIQKVNGTEVLVDNAKVFRPGYKVVFGTGGGNVDLKYETIVYTTSNYSNASTFYAGVAGTTTAGKLAVHYDASTDLPLRGLLHIADANGEDVSTQVASWTSMVFKVRDLYIAGNINQQVGIQSVTKNGSHYEIEFNNSSTTTTSNPASTNAGVPQTLQTTPQYQRTVSVKTIESINYKQNLLFLDTNVSNSVVGETMYQTGAEKQHVDNSRVQRKATTIRTAISANSTNSITVGNASDIAVGDVIVIDVNNDNDTNWDYNSRHTVSSKSGNTLTLDRNVERNIKVGSLVHILTRDVKVHAVDESSDTRPFILVERWTSSAGRNRVVIIQDAWLKGLGRNTNSAYYSGLMQAGYASRYRDDSSADGEHIQSRFDSMVYESPNNRSAYTGINARDSREFVMRNCTSYRTERGYWGYSGNYNWKFCNNYSTRNWYCGFLTDGYYEPYSEFSYFYGTRSDDYGVMFHHVREQMTIRQVILLNHEQRAMYGYYNTQGLVFERFYIDGRRYHLPWFGPGNGKLRFLDSYMRNRWDFSAPDGSGQVYSTYTISGADSRSTYVRTTGHVGEIDFYEHNFEYNGLMESWQGFIRQWDDDERAWVCRNLDDSDAGAFDSVYVPANTTVRLKCDVKLTAGSYTRPFLFATNSRNKHNMGRFRTAYTGQTGILTSSTAHEEGHVGFREQVQYSTAAVGNYETKQLVIQPRKYGYFLIYGIYSSSNIREEEFYMKDVQVFFDIAPSGAKAKAKANKGVAVRAGFVKAKKRIGGTRL